jgi:hypothetical protein
MRQAEPHSCSTPGTLPWRRMRKAARMNKSAAGTSAIDALTKVVFMPAYDYAGEGRPSVHALSYSFPVEHSQP